MMRELLVLLHRWAGLFTAVFLAISGLTGAVISWDHELDEWLNPHFYSATRKATPRPAVELVRIVESRDPRVQVTLYPLAFAPGRPAQIGTEPRIDPATGKPFIVDYNQIFLDPATGEVLGQRNWGAISLEKENFLPFLYKLHYSMHIPDFGGVESWGIWFMGIVAIVWTIDCVVGFCLTLPAAAPAEGRRSWRERWWTAWTIKSPASAYRRNLDIHRAFGLWLWLMLFVLAFTAISMNLSDVVIRPILSTIATLTPDAFEDRAHAPPGEPIEASVSFEQAIAIAETEAQRRGWKEPTGSVYYGREHGLYAVMFFAPGDEHGPAGIGVRTLIVDGRHGGIEGARVPWEGSAADVFVQLQFPIHSGRIAGLPGRIAVSLLGVVVAVLSVTGIVIWARKRAARGVRSRAVSAGQQLSDGIEMT